MELPVRGASKAMAAANKGSAGTGEAQWDSLQAASR